MHYQDLRLNIQVKINVISERYIFGILLIYIYIYTLHFYLVLASANVFGSHH